MNTPLVSIIVPVFNTRPYLEQCFESLVTQTLTLIEIIAVDNGSTDGSLEWLDTFSANHENMHLLVHPAGRQGDARNAGMAKATGDYIGFVDSDDYVDPNMFQKLHKLTKMSGAEVAICNIDYFYQKTGETRKNLPVDKLTCNEKYTIWDRPFVLRNLTICNKLFSADLIRRLSLRFPLGVFHEDQYFVVKALMNANAIMSTPESLYYYRKEREGSVSQDGEHRASDIFTVMNMLEKDVAAFSGTIKLFHELKISRLLQIYASLKGRRRNMFFRQQKKALQEIPALTTPSLLTPTELREFHFLRSNHYWSCELFYCLRQMYGAMMR